MHIKKKVIDVAKTTIEVPEEPIDKKTETALLSEKALAEDWNRQEEDNAWSHLQLDQ